MQHTGYVDGLGRMVQQVTVGAALADNACSSDADTLDDSCDVRVDYRYDGNGQLIQQTVPYAVSTNSSGAWAGQQLSQPSVHTGYDLLGRVSLVTAPDGTQTASSYSDGGESLEQGAPYTQRCMSDANAQTTCTLTDLLGRVRRVSPPLGPQVAYSYDVEDQLVGATCGGASTLLSYDLGGRKVGMDDPDLGSWSYAYDALGNLTRQADARGQRVCLYYDALNRLSGKHYRLDDACPGSPPVSLDVAYAYDDENSPYGIGYRTGMADDSGSTSWMYDARGRMTQESKAVSGSGTFTSGWTYNSADLLASQVYPGGSNNQAGETLIYDYHPQMVLKSVYSSSGYYYVPGISYDAAGRVDVRKLGAVSLGVLPTLQVDYDYFDWGLVNGQGRLKRIQAGPPGNPAGLLDLRYFSETNTPAYDAVGNLLKIYDFKTGSPQTQTYMYDALDRLISASADGTTGNYSENYTYDLATGNLASKDGVNYSYDLNHPHAVTHLGGVQKYWYNANGNMTQRVTNVGTYSLGYDAENRLTEVSGAANATFVYDGDSRRVASTIGGTTAYIGDYFEWNSSTSSMKKYYYAGGTRIALREGNGGGTTGLLWLLGDHLGSTSVVATSSGGLQSKVLYKAWGEDRYISGTLPTGHRYTGQYKDNSINLSWYGSRWYDDSLGRFIQPDPIIPEPYNPLAYDRYQYVYSNPIRYTDNSGYCIDGISTWVCIGVVVGVISKVVDYGWTVYDAWKSGQILNDPNASQVEKDEAAANLAMAATF